MDNKPIIRVPATDRPRGPLFYPDDTLATYELIRELIDLKFFVWRPSKYHIKHGDVNFWPSTGTITIDNVGRHPEKGKQAFIALLQRMYPKGRRARPEAPINRDDLRPPVTVLEINLDGEISGSLSRGQERSDESNATPW
jgi:hypothetical protein